MLTNVIITIVLVLLFLYILITMIQFVKYNRKERYNFIKNFKKGRAFVVYLIALPLIILGISKQGNDLFNSFLAATKMFVDFIVLKLETGNVEVLYNSSIYYKIAIIITYGVTAFSLFLFTISLFGINIANFFRNLILKRRREMYIVIGYNEDNYNMIQDNKNAIIMDMKKDDERLNYIGCAYHHISYYDKVINWLKKIKNFNNKKIRLIVNIDNEKDTIYLTNLICEFIKNKDIRRETFDDYKIFNCYIFGSYENETLYNQFVSDSMGCIHFMNKYKMLAFDFEQNYPLTRYMDENEIDFENAVIRNKTNINVFYIGFGKVNKQLFLTSVCNNQFINEDYEHKKVNYYINGINNDNYEKNLSYTIYRMRAEEIKDEKDYFGLIDDSTKESYKGPANYSYENYDINNPEFYTHIENIIKEDNSYNYIIVSYKDDLDNIDLADKLSQKTLEWQVNDRTKVFARVKNNKLADIINKRDIVIPFGMEENIMSLDNIIKEEYEDLALKRHFAYTKICRFDDEVSSLTKNVLEVIKKQNDDKLSHAIEYDEDFKLSNEIIEKYFIKKTLHTWFNQRDLVRRYSNKYAALNLRVKLNLLGYDYTKNSNDSLIDEFFDKYQKGYLINYKKDNIIAYDNNDFLNNSVRMALASQEHYRWNAYYITNGFISAKKSDIKAWYNEGYKKAYETVDERKISSEIRVNRNLDILKKCKTIEEIVDMLLEINQDGALNNHKYANNYVKNMNAINRTHANITSMEGLKEYREFMSNLRIEASKKYNEELNTPIDELNNDNDVIRYDFEFMDYFKDVAKDLNISIIKKNNK